MCYSQLFLTKLLTWGIIFSTAVRAVVVAKLVTLEISSLTSFILALRHGLIARLVIPGILSSIFLILVLCTSLLTTSCFNTSLSLFKSTGTGTFYQHPIYLLCFLNCLNYLVQFSIP